MIYDGLWHLVYHRKSMIYFGLLGFTIFAYTMIKSYWQSCYYRIHQNLITIVVFSQWIGSREHLYRKPVSVFLPVYWLFNFIIFYPYSEIFGILRNLHYLSTIYFSHLKKNTSLHIFSTSLLLYYGYFINITSYYSVVTSCYYINIYRMARPPPQWCECWFIHTMNTSSLSIVISIP